MTKVDLWLEEENLLLIEGWAKMGLSEEEIAGNMGIARMTLYRWKNRYPLIKEALKKGKEVTDFIVENALFKRATGYTYEEVTKEVKEGEVRVTKIVRKDVPPNTTALIFWLKNRQRDRWRDRWEEDFPLEMGNHGGVVLMPSPLEELLQEEKEKIKEKKEKKENR